MPDNLTLKHEIVRVAFPAVASTDIGIKHTLDVADVEDIDYEVIRRNLPCVVYHDDTPSRKLWQRNLVYLRCNTASAICDIRLSVRDPITTY